MAWRSEVLRRGGFALSLRALAAALPFLAARVSPGWQAFAGYDVELRENSVTHLVSGGLKLRW